MSDLYNFLINLNGFQEMFFIPKPFFMFLRSKFLTKKEINKWIWSRVAWLKSQYITTQLNRILSNVVVRYCIQIGKQPCLKEWSPVTMFQDHFKFKILTDLTHTTPDQMVWEKFFFFKKMQVFAYYKIIAVCRILMSEAWYTMDTLANMISIQSLLP